MQPHIRLRPHHLLCMLTYIGMGYDQGFVNNFNALIERLNAVFAKDGVVAVQIVAGPDEICDGFKNNEGAPCPDADHCLGDSVKRRDALTLQALADAFPELAPKLAVGDAVELSKAHIAAFREQFQAGGAFRAACEGCPWQGDCTKIAVTDNFGAVKLAPPGLLN